MRRVLVTGATGFFGRYVVEALRGRATVVLPDVNGTRADLLRHEDRVALVRAAEADTLIHLAWIVSHGAFWHAPENTLWSEASEALFREFQQVGGRRVLGIGSCAEYDWSQGGVLAEDAPLAPHTAYGQAKLRTARALAAIPKVSAAWGRIFFTYGPGEPSARLVPAMLRAAHDATPLGCGPGDAVRDFWHVRDLADAIAELALSEVSGPVNLGGGDGIRFDHLGSTIERLAGQVGPITFGTRPLGPGEPLELVADTRRLSTEVGFRPKISLEDGLAQFLREMFE